MLVAMFLNEVGLGVLSISFGWYLLVFHSLVNSLSSFQVLPTFRENQWYWPIRRGISRYLPDGVKPVLLP